MNNYTKELTLDIGKKYLLSAVYAKQGDMASRYLKITLMNGAEQYKPASGNTAKFRALKPDGNSVMNPATINSDGTVTCELTSQTLACAGLVKADVVILDGNSKALATASFDIAVERAPIGADIESANEFKEILELIDEASVAVSTANTAASKANTAASSATTAAEKANTAASSATSAASSATSAASSATSAATSATNAASSATSAASSATSAANSASTAATAASSAAEEAEHVNISATQTSTGADITVTDRSGTATTVHVDTLLATDTWEGKRNAVRLGLGPTLFPVGTEFTTDFTISSSTTLTLTWVVRGHNHHQAANGKLQNSMTLETKTVIPKASGEGMSQAFSDYEAIYTAPSTLAAGTYNFTIDGNTETTSDNGETIQFTLTKDLPAGGQLFLVPQTSASTVVGRMILAYSSRTTSSPTEAVQTSLGAEGTSLGTTGTGNLNHIMRNLRGNSNYAQSAIREWLNIGTTTYAATNKFSRPKTFSVNGLLSMLPDDFISAVSPAVIPCKTNSTFEADSLDGTKFSTNQSYTIKDQFFLLSSSEIFGTSGDGTQPEWYEEAAKTDLIKYDLKNYKQYSFTRSPTNVNSVACINTYGNQVASRASENICFTVACIIA